MHMARPTWMLALGGLMVLAAGEAAAQSYPPYGYNPPPYGYNGPRRIVCPLRRPRPLGRPCDCPPPPPPQGYAPGPPLEGRVIP